MTVKDSWPSYVTASNCCSEDWPAIAWYGEWWQLSAKPGIDLQQPKCADSIVQTVMDAAEPSP